VNEAEQHLEKYGEDRETAPWHEIAKILKTMAKHTQMVEEY
jgi:hypothetical protein